MDRTHLRLYTVRSGRALLEGQGWQVENVYCAGSAIQNALAALARRAGQKSVPAILPGLLGYELIYVASSRS